MPNSPDCEPERLKAQLSGKDVELREALAFQDAAADVLALIREHPTEPAVIFQSIVTTASRLCESEYAVFYELKGNHYQQVAAQSADPEWLQHLHNNPPPATRASLAGRTGIEQRTIHIEDVLEDPEYMLSEAQRIGKYRSVLGIPLLRDSKTIAVIVLLRTVVKPFTNRQIQLVETFADQASIAIENARLLAELANKSEQLSTLNETLEARVTEQAAELNRHGQLRNFLPDKIADAVLSDQGSDLLKSHRRNIAAVFCDLRRFTSFSENAEPEEVILVLQQFHEETSRIVAEHDGTIVSRVGDGVLIVLNDPIPIEEPVARAVRLGRDLRTTLRGLSQQWQEYEFDVGFGIGISYGYATLGTVGTDNYQNYTAIGTVVNVASRLSDMADDDEVLVTQRVKKEASDGFKFELKDKLALKGIARTINVFKLMDYPDPSGPIPDLKAP